MEREGIAKKLHLYNDKIGGFALLPMWVRVLLVLRLLMIALIILDLQTKYNQKACDTQS